MRKICRYSVKAKNWIGKDVELIICKKCQKTSRHPNPPREFWVVNYGPMKERYELEHSNPEGKFWRSILDYTYADIIHVREVK